MSFTRIAEVKRANAAAGEHFFEPAEMAFFRSRIESELVDGRWFVTSEQMPEGLRESPLGPRRYTVRLVRRDGTIGTVGEFQGFDSAGDALAHIAELRRTSA